MRAAAAAPEWNFDRAMAENPLVAGQEFYGLANDWGLDFEGAGTADSMRISHCRRGPAAKTWVPIVDWATLRAAHTEHHWNADLCGDDA